MPSRSVWSISKCLDTAKIELNGSSVASRLLKLALDRRPPIGAEVFVEAFLESPREDAVGQGGTHKTPSTPPKHTNLPNAGVDGSALCTDVKGKSGFKVLDNQYGNPEEP